LKKTKGGGPDQSEDTDRGSRTEEVPGDGGPDEAVAFISQVTADLVQLARRHKLEVLVSLLEMTQMEAEEYMRVRSKRHLS
jgi:hypothetical protein